MFLTVNRTVSLLEVPSAGQQGNTCKFHEVFPSSVPIPCTDHFPHFPAAKHQLNSMVFMQWDTAADPSSLPSRERSINVPSEQVCEVISHYWKQNFLSPPLSHDFCFVTMSPPDLPLSLSSKEQHGYLSWRAAGRILKHLHRTFRACDVCHNL